MPTFYILASPAALPRALRVSKTPPSALHYVVKAATETDAVKLAQSYRIGHHWAVEKALEGKIRFSN